MSVRAKFVCTSVTHHANSTAKTVTLSAQYDMGIPEDRRFQKATHWGEFKVMVDNPAAVEQLAVLGRAFYLDVSPCEEEKPSTMVGSSSQPSFSGESR